MQHKKHVDLISLFQKEKPDNTKYNKTAELVIDLTESTSECYTEIDYQLEFAEKNKKHNDSDDDVEDIVAKLERKYGSSNKKSKRKNSSMNFNGYCDSDSFIDNSEAFDEHIPSNLSTLYGGLYINSGPLSFISKERDEDNRYTRVGKYTCLSKPKTQLMKDLGQKMFTLRKGKLRVENRKSLIKKSKDSNIDQTENPTEQTKSTFPLNSFENMFQSLTKQNEEDNDVGASSDSDQQSFSPNEVQLPTEFPSDVTNIVDNLKKVVSESSPESRVKSKGSVNNLLLKLEYKCRHLDKSTRIKVYDYLAPFVKCKRKSLTKRAKNLWVTEENRKANELLEKLKITVGEMMEGLVSENNEVQKLFLWNDEAKKLLIDTIDLQVNCFKFDGKRKDTMESRLMKFINTDVLPIWPEGLMSASELISYYDSVSNKEEKLIDILKQELEVNSSCTDITPDISAVSIDINSNEDEPIDLTLPVIIID